MEPRISLILMIVGLPWIFPLVALSLLTEYMIFLSNKYFCLRYFIHISVTSFCVFGFLTFEIMSIVLLTSMSERQDTDLLNCTRLLFISLGLTIIDSSTKQYLIFYKFSLIFRILYLNLIFHRIFTDSEYLIF